MQAPCSQHRPTRSGRTSGTSTGSQRGIAASSCRARSRTARPDDQVGGIRSFTLGDGTHLREKLLAHSDLDRSYTYDFQKTPFDVDNYCATLRVTPVTDGGGSFVEWFTTFDCDRDQQGHWTDFFASQIFQGGFDALKAHFA